MLIGFTHRVVYALERLVQASKSAQSTQNAIKRSDDSIAFERVVVRTPSRKGDGKTLVENLNVKVNDSLAVSGVGKSSVMRVLAGLWKPESGSVSRPEIGSGGIFFVPQGNYTVQGTLAAQVVYPKLLSETTADPDEIASILEEVGLDALVKRWGLNRVVNWDMILSGGESQRLGFARVIFHHPRFAVLDETTSALDMATEYKCMQALKRHGIKCISFAARPSIAAYHDGKLELEPSVGNNLSRRTTNRSIRSVNTTASKILSFESGDVTGL